MRLQWSCKLCKGKCSIGKVDALKEMVNEVVNGDTVAVRKGARCTNKTML